MAPRPPPSEFSDLLREDGDWRPKAILDRLGPALSGSEMLQYLIVATAILHGAQKVTLLAQRLELEARRVVPRLDTIARDAALALNADRIGEVVTRCREALRTMPAAKARASNDQLGGRGGGLRTSDLTNLVSAVGGVVLGVEMSGRPSPAGITRALRLFERHPPFDLITTWTSRLMPGPAAIGFQLYVPPQLGHPVLVFDDGRLAYDPLPSDDW